MVRKKGSDLSYADLYFDVLILNSEPSSERLPLFAPHKRFVKFVHYYRLKIVMSKNFNKFCFSITIAFICPCAVCQCPMFISSVPRIFCTTNRDDYACESLRLVIS
jgi:hypothetical protein